MKLTTRTASRFNLLIGFLVELSQATDTVTPAFLGAEYCMSVGRYVLLLFQLAFIHNSCM